MSRKLHTDETPMNSITGQIIHIPELGTSFILNSDSSIEYNLSEINAVGIKNITDVVEHRINTIMGSRLHMVRFINEGILTYAYNDAGQLIELASSDLAAEISKNNEILYYVDSDELPRTI